MSTYHIKKKYKGTITKTLINGKPWKGNCKSLSTIKLNFNGLNSPIKWQKVVELN